jgi:hypothetical protein
MVATPVPPGLHTTSGPISSMNVAAGDAPAPATHGFSQDRPHRQAHFLQRSERSLGALGGLRRQTPEPAVMSAMAIPQLEWPLEDQQRAIFGDLAPRPGPDRLRCVIRRATHRARAGLHGGISAGIAPCQAGLVVARRAVMTSAIRLTHTVTRSRGHERSRCRYRAAGAGNLLSLAVTARSAPSQCG